MASVGIGGCSPKGGDANADGDPSISETGDPYSKHGGFSFGPASSLAAKRAGFHSTAYPPDPGDRVICFRREYWQLQGIVTDVEDAVSDGSNGLKAGLEGALVTVQEDSGEEFQCWAVFLSPVNDMEYSSICTTDEFRASQFQRLYYWSANGGSDFACGVVSDIQARESLRLWLNNALDADGETLEVPEEVQQELLHVFNEQPDPSIHLYSRHTKIGPRNSMQKGSDFSIYYLALNNTLNHDDRPSLEYAFPLIKHMVYRLLFTNLSKGRKVLHPGGQVWKGDSEPPVPLNMIKLKEAQKNRTVVRFRQFQSTTTDEKVASRFKRRNDSPGYLWMIDIPADFWGARDIQDVSWKQHETETLFPPYSAFFVESVDDKCCHLSAVYKYVDCKDLSGLDPASLDLNATLT